MSTSNSDAPPKKPVGVAGLFAKAVAAQQAKGPAPKAIDAGVENLVCAHCGAPRKKDEKEERVCSYCGERL